MRRFLPLLGLAVFTAALAQHIPTKSGIVTVTTAPAGDCATVSGCSPSTCPVQYVKSGTNKGKFYFCDPADSDTDGTINE